MSDELEKRIQVLERMVRRQDNTITKLQQALITAGKYENEDPRKELEGVRILLKRAGEAQGRDKGRRR